jgi:hypothetical protein
MHCKCSDELDNVTFLFRKSRVAIAHRAYCQRARRALCYISIPSLLGLHVDSYGPERCTTRLFDYTSSVTISGLIEL